MNTSLIILNYNDPERTASLALASEKLECLKHIVIVDNCSSDDSFAKLSSIRSEKIRLIKARGMHIRDALELARSTFSYTNHTIMQEA